MTITPSVDALMSSTSLRSTTMAASLAAMPHANTRRSSPSVAMSCSPRSQTTVGRVSRPAPTSETRKDETECEDLT